MANRKLPGARRGKPSGSSEKESKLPEMVIAIIEEYLDAPMPETKASKATMLPRKPEDWPSLFEQDLNAGDLEAVMALYEPDARFVARSGETIVGRDRIRDVLAGMIRSKTRLQSRVIKTITVDDVTLLYTDFRGGWSMHREGRLRSATRRSRFSADSPAAPGNSSWGINGRE